MSANSSSAACAVLVRNAESTILDWLSWHLSLGFRQILVIDAGSDDRTAEIVGPLTKGWPIEWQAPSFDPQFSAEERRSYLTRYALDHLIGEEEWITVLDGDEYLVPEPDLPTLLERGKDAAGISLNWCVYGNAGHRQRPRGHLVATHTKHADPSLPDHGFTRLLARSSYLTSPEHTTDPENLDIPFQRLVHADGSPLQEHETTPRWEGGRIQHYVCPSTERLEDLPPPLHRHFDRNDIDEPVSETLLAAARRTQNALWQTLLDASIHHLRAMARQQAEQQAPIVPDPDLHLPESAQRPGFCYERVRPSRHEQLLLRPQAAPPAMITRAFLLRSADGALLEADPSGSQRPLVALIQEHNPRLLCLFARDHQEFTLGDIPSSMGLAAVMTRRTHRPEIFSLPEESGHSHTLFEAIPLPDITPPDFAPLPSLDRRQGLSLEGFLTWIETHTKLRPHDIQRGLALLTKDDAKRLGEHTPELRAFLA